MYEPRELFDFMLARIKDVGIEHGLKLPQAFGRWFAEMYFDKPQNFSISDGSGDGKVDLFFQTTNGKEVDHCILNTKFTQNYNAPAPVAFYDETSRFWQAFANKSNRDEYLSVVRPELRPKYRKLFEYYQQGSAHLFFVTNCRRNENQYRAIKNSDVQIFHLEEVLQFMADYLEDAMPRTPDLTLTGINTVFSADKRDTAVPTSIVFAKLVDFIRYMGDDPYDLIFARNVRLSLGNTPVNKEICRTFRNSPTEFVFSNNGITMLCEHHHHDPGKAEISPGAFTLVQLVGMARQNREDVPCEELKLAFLCFMVLMSLQGFLHQFIERAGSLGDRVVHVVRADRPVIFFGIFVRHTGEVTDDTRTLTPKNRCGLDVQCSGRPKLLSEMWLFYALSTLACPMSSVSRFA